MAPTKTSSKSSDAAPASDFQSTGVNTFPARVTAADMAHHLNQILVERAPPDDVPLNPFSPELRYTADEERRYFTLGHWRFFFTTFLEDQRGAPPAIWLMLEISHRGERDSDPVIIASFYNFEPDTCEAIIYDPGTRSDRLMTIGLDDAVDELVIASARGFIEQYLESRPPAAKKVQGFFARFFGTAASSDLDPDNRPMS